MAKRFFSLIFSVIVSLIALLVVLIAVGHAQGPEPIAYSIEPDMALAGRDSIITFKGANFAEPFTVTLMLNAEVIRTLDSNLVSSSEIQVSVPGDLSVGSYRLQIQFKDSSDRFPFAIIAPEPKIDSVKPAEFWNKQDVELTIGGAGLSLSPLVVLGTEQLEDTQILSDTILKAVVPADFEPGDYQLSLLFSDGRKIQYKDPFIVHQYIAPAITSVPSSTLYNNRDRYLKVSGDGFVDLSKVFLGEQELNIEEHKPTEFTATIPISFTAGEYPLVLDFKHGERITAEQKVIVRDPINAEISSIVPDELMNIGEKTATVDGVNLGEVEYIRLARAGGSVVASVTMGEKKNDRLEILIPADAVTDQNSSPDERYDVKFFFPDETDLSSEIVIYRSVVPHSAGGWVGLATIVGGLLLVTLTLYNMVIGGTSSHKLNKTSPGLLTVVGLVVGVLAVVFVWGVIMGFVWSIGKPSLSSGQYRYLLVWLLVGTEISLSWQFAHWTGYFYKVLSTPIRIVIALGASVLAFIVPFLLNNADTIVAAVWVEAGLVVLTVVWGLVGSRLVHRRLEEERQKGPSDQEILLQVEQTLYRKGQVSAESDFPDLPRDRVKNALERYVADHRDKQAFEYLDFALRLSFQRREEVRRFSEGFDDLRKLIVGSSNDQDNVRKASKRLAEIIQSQMQCTRGKPFSLRDVPPEFAVYSLESQELESVLPTPFPLIVFLSHTAIFPEQIQQLKQLQNQLDVPSRFAVLLPIGEATTSRRSIHSALGGVARENIAVLGDREWLNILTSTEEIQLAFMEAIQDQVDLTIFSPYKTEGPTKLDMFFGRTDEIATVTESINDGSIAVLGARRIGKTSMLQAVFHILEERGKFLLYLDCYGINSYESFFKEIANRWRVELPQLEMKSYKTITDFPRLVVDLQELNPDRQILFQFDEIDRLLAYDTLPKNDELMFRMFRSLAQQKKCQFLFSGERKILDKLSDPKSSFFNFATPVYLGLLDLGTTSSLIQKPMALVGISIKEGERVSEMIFKATGGHPNLIQTVCELLLNSLHDSKTRVITPELVEQEVNSSVFRDKYLEIFWSQANPLEKAMSIVACELSTVGERDLLRRLREVGFKVTINQIKRGLRYLSLSHLFTSVDGQYTLKPDKFAEILLAYSLDEWLETFLMEWEEQGESEQ